MAYTIRKSADAPEGLIRSGAGNKTYTVDDDKPYETDDMEIVEAAQHFPEYFEVVFEEDVDVKAAVREENKARKELDREQARAKKQRAEKDATERPADIPETVADLEKADDAKGDK